MSRKIVFRNDQKISEITKSFEKGKNLLQNVVTEFSKLDIGAISNRDEYLAAISDPEKFAFDEAVRTVERQSSTGFRIKKSKLVEMADLPNFDGFVEACKRVQDHPSGLLYSFHQIGDCKKGEVSVNKKLLDAFIDRHSVYAETSREQQVAELLQTIANACNELQDLGMHREFGNNRVKDVLIDYAMDWRAAPNFATYRRLTSRIKR